MLLSLSLLPFTSLLLPSLPAHCLDHPAALASKQRDDGMCAYAYEHSDEKAAQAHALIQSKECDDAERNEDQYACYHSGVVFRKPSTGDCVREAINQNDRSHADKKPLRKPEDECQIHPGSYQHDCDEIDEEKLARRHVHTVHLPLTARQSYSANKFFCDMHDVYSQKEPYPQHNRNVKVG